MRRSQRTSVGLWAVALLVVGPGFALAEEPAAVERERNGYIVFKAGPYFPTATNAVDALGGITFSWPVSYALELGVGGYWGLFGLQFSVGHLKTGTSDVDVHSHPFLLLARLRLPLGLLAPYLEGGAGVAIANAMFNSLVQGQGISNTQAAFEAVGGAGVDIYLGPLLLGAELKYIWLDPSFDVSGVTGVTSFTKKLNMSGITLVAYVGYRF